MRIHKFGNCYVNVSERRIIKDGKFIKLTPKPFDILVFLIEHHGEIVSKDELLEKIWNDSFVEEGNLAVHISKLRRLLNADENESFIEAVQSSGYRFISSVKTVNDKKWKNHLPVKSRRQSDKFSEKFTFDFRSAVEQ